MSFFNNKNKQITVSMDGLLTIQGKDVVINCSNASESWWDTDDFYLEWHNDTMTGYNIDKKGRRGNAVFRFVGLSSSTAPAPPGESREQQLVLQPGSNLPPVTPQPPPKPVVPTVSPEFPRKWRVEWRGGRTNALYTGLLLINNKINDKTYTGSLVVKTPQGYEVSQDAIVYLDQSKVEIKCSNSNVPKYPSDNFFLNLSGNTMKGYDRDVKGNIGFGVTFTADKLIKVTIHKSC